MGLSSCRRWLLKEMRAAKAVARMVPTWLNLRPLDEVEV
jgi:hypothetical protein